MLLEVLELVPGAHKVRKVVKCIEGSAEASLNTGIEVGSPQQKQLERPESQACKDPEDQEC